MNLTGAVVRRHSKYKCATELKDRELNKACLRPNLRSASIAPNSFRCRSAQNRAYC